MSNKSDEIFILRNGEIEPLVSRSMRIGLLGKNLEDALQTLFEKYPQLIPGRQIDPGSEDPPRFILLRREMPVGAWALDHLFADQRGVLTLVETKLIENPESRREVIGQIIEYAANAIELWSGGKARQKASEYWVKKGKDLDEILLNEFGDQLDLDDYWKNIESNLRNGRLRLIIAADELRPEVRRMIEYLNKEMQNAEVYGLELRCFGDDNESLVMVPRLIGQTQESIDRKSTRKATVAWSYDKLKNTFEELSDKELARRLLKVLEWAIGNRYFVEAVAMNPNFGIRSKKKRRCLSFNAEGGIYAFFEEKIFSGGKEDLDNLQEQLKHLKILPAEFNHNEVISGRNLAKKLQELTEEEIDALLSIYANYCG